MSAGIIRIGTSGWTYAEWRGVFYPKGLKREQELSFAASQFAAIEINGTFYGQQRPDTFANWARQVPAHVQFAVKAPRFITHVQRLRDVEAPIANFIASGLLRLGSHLGPILWQLPPSFRFDPVRLEPFLRLLPRDTPAAARLGQRHDSALRSPPALDFDMDRPIRHALEVRHDSFVCPEFIDLLRAHDVALVCSDGAGLPRFMDVTAGFVYCRLHGATDLYASGYDAAELDSWAERLRLWTTGGSVPQADRLAGVAPRRKRDVYLFFDNTMKVAAPTNALELMRRLRR
ncbi:MAG: DUF72 domain-containing protein [Acetobacteraceae bacterium]|nr:DUF72 domain-containing protein [Pseudomonadota bacterium]